MKRALLVLVLVLVFLAFPAVATAKGQLTSAEVCGTSGCSAVDQPSQALTGGGDGVPDLAPAPEPYHTVRMTVQHGGGSDSRQMFYLPGSAMVALPGEDEMIFERIPSHSAEAFRNAARGVEPYPVPTVTGATVGGRPVVDPASYLALFGVEGGADAYPTEPDFVPILLRSTRPSPWTSAGYFLFSPSAGALIRAGEVVELPDALADAIAAHESLAGDVSRSSSGFDWPLVSIMLLSALGLALASALIARPGRRAATA